MVKKIEFWRTVSDSHGGTHHSVLRTYVMEDSVPDDVALQTAQTRFCEQNHVRSWSLRADGYQFAVHVDERRVGERRDIDGPERRNGPLVSPALH